MYRRIRDLREDSDLKQKTLAEYLTCSQVCYSQYELGKRDIPTDVLIKLADYYGTSIDYLLGRTDCPEEGEKMFKNKKPRRHVESVWEKCCPPADGDAAEDLTK
ncbi:MAG: helix-turn-helix transcriptional regulator [Oscillospiraceae bacterium]|nr:helix-turn-helix transcriptional regulator [Oscillospiraceae bacterium]MCI9309292.1 helix-turn-helix transcriptional regulator [Oscillospiraceae bacterium]MCI9549660.1 helix-turn-helix transcriptional regulator [Oscillospiraceae bacterium]